MSNQMYVKLNNGVEMPMVGIGTFMLSPDEAEASCVSALKDGYKLIDTANAYVNEKAVYCAMKKSGLARKEIFLETKLYHLSTISLMQLKKRLNDLTQNISTFC